MFIISNEMIDYRVVVVLAVRAAVPVAGIQRDPLLVQGQVALWAGEWVVHDSSRGHVGCGSHWSFRKRGSLGGGQRQGDVLIPDTCRKATNTAIGQTFRLQLVHFYLIDPVKHPLRSYLAVISV